MPSNPNGARSKRTAWLSPVAAAVALAAVATPARALDYTLGSQFGPIGATGGAFRSAVDVEISAFNNQVYIVDQNNHRVQRFSKAGVYLGAFGSLGNGAGQLTRPSGIAIDNEGNAWVADQDNNRIAKFSPTGTHIGNYGSFGSGDGQFNTVSLRMGIAYSARFNFIFATDARNSRIQRFTTAGAYSSKFGTLGGGNGQLRNPSSVGVDRDGNIYVADTNNNRIQRFNASGAYQIQWGTGGTANGQFDRPSGVSVDTTGIVHVADGGGANKRIQAFTTSGVHLATYGSPSGTALNSPLGVVSDADGTVWVVDSLADEGKAVNILTPGYASDTVAPASTITQSPAKNANGFNNTSVAVTINAVDDVGGSRVKEIRYTVNMGAEQVASFSPAPSASTTFNLSDSGIYTISYWSVDNRDNVETAKSFTVSIDKQIPVASGFIGVGQLWIEASDDTGVQTIEYAVDAGATQTYSGPVTLPAGSGVVRYWARDLAGNVSTTRYLAVGAYLKSITFTPTPVFSGGITKMTITLAAPAPPGGLPLSLVSSNPSVISVPASTVVPAGATTRQIDAQAGIVTAESSATVTASTDSGQSVANSVVVLVPGPKTLTIAPSVVTGGSGAVGTVTLSAAAATGGVVVTLTSLDPSVSVPATVTVPAGSTTVTFPLTTSRVNSDRASLISAEVDGTVAVSTLLVRRIALRSITFAPSSVVGGTSSTGTVNLASAAPTGGVSVALLSTDSAVQVPATVEVAEGATSATFTATTGAVASNRAVSVRAIYGGGSVRATLLVTPGRLNGFTFTPNPTPGGVSVTARVALSGPAPTGGRVVGLRSLSSLITVPATVTVPEGESSVLFTVTSPYVTANQSISVLAFTSVDSRTGTLNLVPTAITTVTLNPTSVVGGNASQVTVNLNGPAPEGGLSITLSSSRTQAAVPTTVTIPAGETSVSATVETIAVTTNLTATIGAKITGSTTTRSAVLTITKP